MADNAQRPARGASIVNTGFAALAAGALGFLVFAMPEDIFSDLIVRSGLPAYLPAAEPPLGMKARAGAIGAVALLVFAFVLLLLRGIDRLSSRPAQAEAEPVEPEADAPRLRRADAHPDAPAPRPILAGRDLGGFTDSDEYDYPPEADDEMFADLPAQPLPGFLAANRDPSEEVVEQKVEAAELAEPEPDEEAFEEAGFGAEQAEEEPLLLDTPADDRSSEALVSQRTEAEEIQDNSITSLMRRLETGLERREEQADQPGEQPSAPPSWLAPQPATEETADHQAEPAEAWAVEDRGTYGSAQASPPPSWLAPQPAAEPSAASEEIEAHRSEEAEPREAETYAAEPVQVSAANFPQVDEFGEPSWPAPPAGEPQFAPLGAQHRQPAESKVQALPPQPVISAPAEAEAPAEMSIGRRLRSAIADMDRIASSGG